MESALVPETEIFEIKRSDAHEHESPDQVDFSSSSMGSYGVTNIDKITDPEKDPDQIRQIDLAKDPEKLLESHVKHIEALTHPYIVELYDERPITEARNIGINLKEGLKDYRHLSFEYAAVARDELNVADTGLYLSADRSDLPTVRGLITGYCKFAYPEEEAKLLAEVARIKFEELVPKEAEVRAIKIADQTHRIANRISPAQLSQNLDTHEYLHAIKAIDFNAKGKEFDQTESFQKTNFIVMEEALAIMHELRGAVIENNTEVTDTQRLYLQLRLAEVAHLSYGCITIQRTGIKQIEPELNTYIDRLQDVQQVEQYYYDPHKLAVMLLLLGPEVLSEDSNLANLPERVSINDLIDNILDDPDKFIQSLNGDVYDAFYAKYQLALHKCTVDTVSKE